jgi:hypothetical protein
MQGRLVEPGCLSCLQRTDSAPTIPKSTSRVSSCNHTGPMRLSASVHQWYSQCGASAPANGSDARFECVFSQWCSCESELSGSIWNASSTRMATATASLSAESGKANRTSTP